MSSGPDQYSHNYNNISLPINKYKCFSPFEVVALYFSFKVHQADRTELPSGSILGPAGRMFDTHGLCKLIFFIFNKKKHRRIFFLMPLYAVIFGLKMKDEERISF